MRSQAISEFWENLKSRISVKTDGSRASVWYPCKTKMKKQMKIPLECDTESFPVGNIVIELKIMLFFQNLAYLPSMKYCMSADYLARSILMKRH